MTSLSHVTQDNHPTMVDVTHKQVTARTATARATVVLPPPVAIALADNAFRTAKGPVFDTAIIAGVMAAKRTHDLIPFCHPLAIENCTIDIRMEGDSTVLIDCTVSVHHKTGVEMEALTGASVAALTIYDMCKALSHDIVIAEVKLLQKRGGKSDK